MRNWKSILKDAIGVVFYFFSAIAFAIGVLYFLVKGFDYLQQQKQDRENQRIEEARK